jgi:hypothetical protein
MTAVSPLLTFPNIAWWMHAINMREIIFDGHEHFEKMTYRNRYRICGANNSILLSVPLERGREQRMAMNATRIYNSARWQVQHWRTLVSVYNRSPYFSHYEHSLKPLFETPFELLVDFNLATIKWAQQQLKLKFAVSFAETYIKKYPEDVIDLRHEVQPQHLLPRYYQVFEDRVGFLYNLSVLDLLFSEGPAAAGKLKAG